MKENSRIKWIDVARCFGIFAIFLGHYGAAAGNAYTWVFTHHVPLFFLISGCMESLNNRNSIRKTIHRVGKNILIPWFVFGIASIILFAIREQGSLAAVGAQVINLIKGTTRNHFVAGGLWFLTCIAVIQIAFAILKKIKCKLCILGICLALSVIAYYALPNFPLHNPSLPYNLDSAMYYILFYAIGYVSFPWMKNALECKKTSGRITIGATALVCLAYAALLFFGKDLLSYVPSFIGWAFIKSIVRPLLIIWVYIVVSKLLENVSILGAIGQNTLYLCGSEYIIKKLFGDLLLVFGLSQNYSNPMTTYLCSALLLLVLHKYFVPLEKKFFAWIYQLPSKFTAGD